MDRGLGERFESYAKRVQTVSVGRFTRSRVIDQSVLSCWFTIRGLFPRFRNLFIECSSSYQWTTQWPRSDVLDALLRPMVLKALNIHLVMDHVQAALLEGHMSKLLECSIYLEELRLHRVYSMRWDDSGWANLLSIMVSRATRLRILETTFPVNYQDFMHLSRLPALGELRINMVIDVPKTALHLPSHAFQHLSTLRMEDDTRGAELTCSTLSFGPKVLSNCNLHISPNGGMEPFDIASVAQRLSIHTSLTSVSLYLSWSESSSPTLEDSTAFFNALNSLKVLENLSLFQHNSYLPIDTSIVSNLLHACPLLRFWTIEVSNRMNYERKRQAGVMPFTAFLDILHKHPNIRSLPIRLSIDTVPSPLICTNIGVHSYFSELVFEHTENVAELERVIKQVLPKVGAISVIQQDGMPKLVRMRDYKATSANQTSLVVMDHHPQHRANRWTSCASRLLSLVAKALCMA
jgi:hypothetical protein